MLLLLAIGACTSSEEEIIGSIYGKVTDSKNGKVLQGVTITLIPGGLSRTTGSDGTYSTEPAHLQELSFPLAQCRTTYTLCVPVQCG